MEISLHVTNQCNLNCTYCYQKEQRVKEDMELDVLYEIVERTFDILKNSTEDSLKINFIGGEPLINFSIIKYCVNLINEKLDSWQGKVYYSMTTNGILLNDEIINVLSNNNFKILLSIDGNKSIHDQNRKDFSNQGTFERVMSAKELLINSGIYPIARMTIPPDNDNQNQRELIV